MSPINFRPLSITEEISKARNTPSPFVINLSNGRKRLVCFGLEHTSDSSHPQFRVFDEFLDSFDSGVSLVESPDISKSLLPELKQIVPSASKKGLVVRGVDLPLLGEIIKFSSKYDPKDAVLFRAIVYLNKPDRKGNVHDHIDNFLQMIKSENDFSVMFEKSGLDKSSLLDLLELYTFQVLSKGLSNITPNDSLFPSPVDEKHVLNKYCRDISLDRDSFMLKKLQEALEEFDSVFYILGKNHIIRQEDTIREIYKEVIKSKENT